MNDKDYARDQIRRSQSKLRRLIKHFYVAEVLSKVSGPTLDIGCGAGQILERLPKGSLGLESNEHLVSYLGDRGLPCRRFYLTESISAQELFGDLEFQSLVLSHVLEHFPEALRMLGRLLEIAGQHQSLDRILIIVPTERGYASDATHRTFISLNTIKDEGLQRTRHFELSKTSYFPVNQSWLGPHFVYHELHLLWTRR